MTFMRILLIVLLYFLNAHLQADTAKPKPVPVTNSQQNRSEKEWQAVVGMGHLWPLIGGRARGSYFLDGDSLVFLDLSGGSDAGQDLLSLFSSQPGSSTKGGKAAVGFKQFLANSFYWEGSGFYRSIERLESHFPKDFEFSSKTVDVELVIGNQWQMNRFTLGVDWIGIQVPLSVLDEKALHDDHSTAFVKKKKDFESFDKSVQPIFMGFYLGFSF